VISKISVIVIGLNEAENLEATFNAIISSKIDFQIELIYVDSGSNDESISIAARFTDKIFIEDQGYRSAARNRNRGLIESTGEIIHFLDGDVKLAPDYLAKAVEIILDKKAEAACGKMIEINQNQVTSIISSSWDTRMEGYMHATHAGGTYLKSAIMSVGGYNPKIKMGEETELGLRFSEAGYKIYYIDEPMGYHDYNISNIFHYFKKQIGDGKCKTDMMFLREKNDFIRLSDRYAISNLLQMTIFIFLFLILLFLNLWVSIFILGLFLVFPFIKTLYRKDQKLKYLLVMHYSKPWVFYGQLLRFLQLLINRNLRKVLLG